MSEEEYNQYKQCAEDWRYYDRAMWELPSISIAVTTGVVAISYQVLPQGVPRLLVLLFGFLMQTSFTVALWKHRVFQSNRIEVLRAIENKWIADKKIDFRVARTRRDLANMRFAKRVSATILLSLTMFTMAISLLALLLMDLYALGGLP